MIYYENGRPENNLSHDDLRQGLYEGLRNLGERKKVMVIPPDFTRFPSRAGILTEMAWEYYGDRLTDILPALGTHTPMTDEQIGKMFGRTPKELFRVHDWRNDVITLGRVPSDRVAELTEGKLHYSWPAQVNKMLVFGRHDLILSVGQVVPHEVVGMANYSKNIFVGTGGPEGINKSHFVGAVYGMERMMGHADTPVRRLFNYASEHFAKQLPIVYVLTVVGVDDEGNQKVAGLFVGNDYEVFERAAKLSLEVNFKMLEQPLKKVVVWMDPSEFKSTWLSNKSIYRTRMAIADGGELIVLAPALREFGEDPEIDKLIRKYGYKGTPHTLQAVDQNEDIRNNLSAAAHLIHGSSEGRFTITYCPGKEPGNLTREEIESVGFAYGDLDQMLARYDVHTLREGYNTLADGEEVYYISTPALGLWAYKERFNY